MPFFLQAAISSSSIGRDALATSISPAQNFSKPPPVPDSPTVIFTFGLVPWKLSADAWAKGYTVLDPSTVTLPERSPLPLSLLLPQPVATNATATTRARIAVTENLKRGLECTCCSFRGPG